ncbi:MAG: TlpA family protein disulfide reductase [Spirochaetia bacterium]|nr:TlpA family protein disulfide reductase [Spirochaetia bacterium]
MIGFLKRNGFNIALLFCILGFVTWQRIPMYVHGQSLEGMELSNVTVATIDGKQLRLADYKDRTVILSFWATWCLPCRVERPSLVSLKDDLKGEPFEIIGISDERPDVLRKFLAENAVNFPIAVDTNATLHTLLGIESYPTIVQVVNGKVVSVSHGLNPFLKFIIRHRVTGSYF